MSDMPLPADVITHRGSMLLLEGITAADDEMCVAECLPRADAWYADAAGNMPAWIGVELMAQTVAAQVGVQKSKRGLPPKLGMLLGARSYKAEVPSFAAEQALSVSVRLLFRDESGLAAYDCDIRHMIAPQQLLASATLKVFEPDDLATLLKGSTE